MIRELSQLIEWRGAPQQIRVDNRPEFIAYALVDWCSEKNIHLQFIQPGKPSQNGFVEPLNRSYREEILDAHWFTSLEEVRQLTHQWIGVYNHDRPHEALGNLSPLHFLLKYGKVGDDFSIFQQEQSYQFSLFSTVTEQTTFTFVNHSRVRPTGSVTDSHSHKTQDVLEGGGYFCNTADKKA